MVLFFFRIVFLLYSLLFPRLRFDDDRVTPVTLKEVFDENFGDEPVKGNGNALFMNGRNNSMRMMRRFTNAYMLVYMRRSKLDEVLGAVEDSDIPPHLRKWDERPCLDS